VPARLELQCLCFGMLLVVRDVNETCTLINGDSRKN
jgi:hypothetical protein